MRTKFSSTCSWFCNHTKAVCYCFLFFYFLIQSSLIMLLVWSNRKSCSLVTVLLFQLSPPIWVIKIFRDPVPTKPFDFHPHPNPSLKHSGAFSVLLGLWWVVLPLAGVPEEQRDANWGQSHHTECSPVQLKKGDMGEWDSHKKKNIFVNFAKLCVQF